MANYKNQKNDRSFEKACAVKVSNVYKASAGANLRVQSTGEKPVMGLGADKKDALTDNVTDVFDIIDDSGDIIDDVGDLIDDVGDFFDSFLKDVKEIFRFRDRR